MEYINLVEGILFIIVMTWILRKNWKRNGFFNALLRVDTISLIIVGFYLVVSSIQSLIF